MDVVGTGKTTGMSDSAVQGPNKLLLKMARTTKKMRSDIDSCLDKKGYDSSNEEQLRECAEEAAKKGIGGSQSLTADDYIEVYKNKTLKELEENNTERQGLMSDTHKELQQRFESLDVNYYISQGMSEDEALEKAKNEAGPHERTVIRGFMKRMHWNKYLDGSDDDRKILEIGTLAVTPKQMRECLAELTGWDGKGSLSEHIEKNVRIQPGTQRMVYVTGEGKEIEIGNDTWRMAGDESKISGSLGKDLRECLEEKNK